MRRRPACRLEEMEGQEASYECVVRAKIRQGGKLKIRAGAMGLQYSMDLSLSDDEIEVPAVLDNNFIMHIVGECYGPCCRNIGSCCSSFPDLNWDESYKLWFC